MMRFEMDLPVPRDSVWQALTDPGMLSRWLCRKAEVQLHVGGLYDLFFEQNALIGCVFSIDRPRLLHVGAIDSGDDFEIIAELVPTLDGTRLKLTHSTSAQKPAAHSSKVSSDAMWMNALEKLRTVLAKNKGE